jgi:hypothetical protein
MICETHNVMMMVVMAVMMLFFLALLAPVSMVVIAIVIVTMINDNLALAMASPAGLVGLCRRGEAKHAGDKGGRSDRAKKILDFHDMFLP